MSTDAIAPDGAALSGEIALLLQEVTGEDDGWCAAITPDTRVDSDLFLDSVETAALADRVRRRYGARADLAGWLASLSIDEIIALRVADVAGFVAAHRDPVPQGAGDLIEGRTRAGAPE
jgi:acyl carrier protein